MSSSEAADRPRSAEGEYKSGLLLCAAGLLRPFEVSTNLLQHCTGASNDLYVVGVRWSAATMVRLMSGASTALRSGLSLGELLGRVRDHSSSALAWYALYSVHVPIRGVLSVASSSVTTLVDSRLFPHLRGIVQVWVRTLFAPVLFVCGGTLERYNQRTPYER